MRRQTRLRLVPSRRPGHLVSVIAATLLLASGCGNAITTDINGMTGVTVDLSGRPILVAELCDGVVGAVTVTGPNRGETANEIRADLLRAEPVDESFVLDLATPAAEWTGTALDLPVGTDLYIAYAHGGDTVDSQLSQVTFTGAELAELEPGLVQFGSSEPGKRPERAETAAFAGTACP